MLKLEKKRSSVLLCVAAMLFGPFVAFGQVKPQSNLNSADANSYFPAGIFAGSKLPQSDVFAEWLAKDLINLNEPSLFRRATNGTGDIFRLLRISPLGTNVVVRLEIHDDTSSKLTTKVAWPDGRPLYEKHTTVTDTQVHPLLGLLTDSHFWTLQEAVPQEGPHTSDGTAWLIEAVHNGTYHAVYRTDPKIGWYTEVGRYMAKDLAKLDDSIFNVPEYRVRGVILP